MQRLPLHPGQRRLFPATACVDFYRFRRIPPEQRQNQDTIDAAMQIAYVLMHVSDLPLWFRLEPTHVSVVSGSSPSELVVAWPPRSRIVSSLLIRFGVYCVRGVVYPCDTMAGTGCQTKMQASTDSENSTDSEEVVCIPQLPVKIPMDTFGSWPPNRSGWSPSPAHTQRIIRSVQLMDSEGEIISVPDDTT